MPRRLAIWCPAYATRCSAATSPTPVLAPRITSAASLWLDWHHDFALNQAPLAREEDERLLRQAAALDDSAETYIIDDGETALQVWAK